MSSPVGSTRGYTSDSAYRNYRSNLPEIYLGHPNRLERYNQYEQMDMDPELTSALDIIAEFSTQTDLESNLPLLFIIRKSHQIMK